MDINSLQFIDTEKERIDALHRYQILDTSPDPAFDRITVLAANIFSVPVALITFVDQSRTWIKSHYGTEVQEYERALSLCSTAILDREPFIINDTSVDPRYAIHPLASQESGVRFYAGIPLTVQGNHNIGVFCIIDRKPRSLNADELKMLNLLSKVVTDELELHLNNIKIHELNKGLENSEHYFRSLFDQAGVGVSIENALTGTLIQANQRYCDILGYTSSELQVLDLKSITHPDDVVSQNKVTQALNSSQIHEYNIQKRCICKDNSTVWVDLTCTALWKSGEEPTANIAVIHDITDKKLAELALIESEERWKFALEGSDQGIWDLNVSVNHIYLSTRCKEMLGYKEEQISSDMHEWLKLIHPDDLPCLISARQLALDGSSKIFENEHRKLTSDGSWKWIQVKGMVVHRDEAGLPLRIIGTYTDINEKKLAEAEVLRLAHFDGITNLPNRNLFLDRLSQEFKKANRSGKFIALIMLDLDRFKEINDTLGHQKGDFLIKLVAERLLECVRETDTVGRLGGDEFTIILTELDDFSDVELVAFKILDRLAMPYQLEEDLAYVTASLGITLYPNDGTEIEILFKNADQAMYAAKNSGRNRHCYFTPLMQKTSNDKAYLTSQLRNALTNNELSVVYQPIMNLITNEMHKAEALLRWNHPKKGDIAPSLFIPIAEETGQIVEIGNWVFKQAVSAVKLCREKIYPDFQIGVNKSPVQFKQEERPHLSWFEYLATLGLPGNSIVVEITEGLLLEKTESLKNQFDNLKSAGIQVALDDFGTGYSSISYLKLFDIDYIKIDQMFVKNLSSSQEDLALCEAMIVMAHKLGILVIAEGVETVQQLELLKVAGCDYAQGYLFSKAVPLNKLMNFRIA